MNYHFKQHYLKVFQGFLKTILSIFCLSAALLKFSVSPKFQFHNSGLESTNQCVKKSDIYSPSVLWKLRKTKQNTEFLLDLLCFLSFQKMNEWMKTVLNLLLKRKKKHLPKQVFQSMWSIFFKFKELLHSLWSQSHWEYSFSSLLVQFELLCVYFYLLRRQQPPGMMALMTVCIMTVPVMVSWSCSMARLLSISTTRLWMPR